MDRLYLCRAIGGAHGGENHGGGAVTKFRLANRSASCTASCPRKDNEKRRRGGGGLHSGQPKEGRVYGIQL